MKKYTYKEIRDMYLELLKDFDHEIIPGVNLLPDGDATLLFVNSGMFPIVPYLAGETHPKGNRIANVQRCVRAKNMGEMGDSDDQDVGDNTHNTAFEMLGHWSLNDYFKETAIEIAVKFYIEKLGFNINDFYVSVFEGNENSPKDEDAINIWKEVFEKYGVEPTVGFRERIQPLDESENWWELAGGGPCGPCSEMFLDTGIDYCSDECDVSCSCEKFVELGNNVFMQFLSEAGQYKPLGRHNVDFGGGLVRITMLSQGVTSLYETDIFKPIYDCVKQIASDSQTKPEDDESYETSLRIITDHIHSACWMIMDGILPSKSEQGFVLRRLIRRAIRHARKLGVKENFTNKVAEVAISQFSPIYPELNEKKDAILNAISEEEERFNKTISNGIKEFNKLVKQNSKIDGKESFKLFETYGFPFEITQELAREQGIEEPSFEEFKQAKADHKKKSQSAAKGLFKGGLADTTDASTHLHTATHLLNESLRRIVGDHIVQRGSNITPERLRFDFPCETKLTPEQLLEVENMVNDQIENALNIKYEVMNKEDALKIVNNAQFADRYPDEVNVYFIGDKDNAFSVEICRGPHANNTSEIGKFKIVKHENIGSGLKRIKAVLEK